MVEAGHKQRYFEIKTICALENAIFDDEYVPSCISPPFNYPELTRFMEKTSVNKASVNQKFRMIQSISSTDKYIRFNQGDIVFPGDSKKYEVRRVKAFEIMCILSQVLELGKMYSQKHHNDLYRNNFRFIRHS